MDQPEQSNNNLHFTKLLIRTANAVKTTENTEFFSTKHQEYIKTSETHLMQQCSQFLKNKRRWEEIAIIDVEAKKRKMELDNVTRTIAALEDERAIKQMSYERAASRVSTQVNIMMESIRATEEGGISALAHSNRECVICRNTKRETLFVRNVICSHSTCYSCLKRSRESGTRTCMICRAKQPSTAFIMLCESQGYRYVAIPM